MDHEQHRGDPWRRSRHISTQQTILQRSFWPHPAHPFLRLWLHRDYGRQRFHSRVLRGSYSGNWKLPRWEPESWSNNHRKSARSGYNPVLYGWQAASESIDFDHCSLVSLLASWSGTSNDCRLTFGVRHAGRDFAHIGTWDLQPLAASSCNND